MKKYALLIVLASLVVQLASAQPTPERTWMLGPVVGSTQVGYGSVTGGKGLNVGTSPSGISFGVDGSYQVRRCLIDVKLLYQKRTYLATSSGIFYDSSPNRVLRTETDFEVLTLPFSGSYRLTPDANFQWFIGGNIAAEYLLNVQEQRLYNADGAIGRSPDRYIGVPINLGLGVQTTFRYRVLPRTTLQLEPALRYYPTGGFPTRSTGTFQFQGTAAVLVRL